MEASKILDLLTRATTSQFINDAIIYYANRKGIMDRYISEKKTKSKLISTKQKKVSQNIGNSQNPADFDDIDNVEIDIDNDFR